MPPPPSSEVFDLERRPGQMIRGLFGGRQTFVPVAALVLVPNVHWRTPEQPARLHFPSAAIIPESGR